jgi:hypothetical protein
VSQGGGNAVGGGRETTGMVTIATCRENRIGGRMGQEGEAGGLSPRRESGRIYIPFC